MSDIRPTPGIKLDPAARKRIEDSAKEFEGLEKQINELEKLGIFMGPIREQIDWAKKARATLLKDFT